MIKNKKLIFVIIFLFLSLLLIWTVGFKKYSFEELEELKYCELDSDCKSNSSCYAGCWNKKPSAGLFGTSIGTGMCPDLGGPSECVCRENRCESGDIENGSTASFHYRSTSDYGTISCQITNSKSISNF